MSVDTQLATTQMMTMAAAYNSAIDLAMGADDKVILLGEDIADPAGGVFKVTNGMSTKYGTDRVLATPIAETAIVGAAVGAAMGGYRPVAEIMFMDFLTVCMDPLVNHAAKLRYMSGGHTPVPMTLRTTVGGQRFGAQHAQSLEAWLMHIPGLKVAYPSTPADAKGLLTASIRDDDPVVVIENLALYYTQKAEVPVGEHVVELGQSTVRRSGKDVTIVTWGSQVHHALAAAKEMADRGVEAEVIDLRTLVPLDLQAVLESAERTRRVAVVHDATTFAGPGAEIAARVNEELFGELLAPVRRVGAANTPVPFARTFDHFPSTSSIVAAIEELTAT